MTIFSSLAAARKYGFCCYDFDAELELYVVVRDERRDDGVRYRSLALARANDRQDPASRAY